MIPLTAMTHFLPTAERQNRTSGWPRFGGFGIGAPTYRMSSSASSAPPFWSAVESSCAIPASPLPLPVGPPPGGFSETYRPASAGDDPEPLQEIVVGIGHLTDLGVPQREADVPGVVRYDHAAEVRDPVRRDVTRPGLAAAVDVGLDDRAGELDAPLADHVDEALAGLEHRQHRPARVPQR